MAKLIITQKYKQQYEPTHLTKLLILTNIRKKEDYELWGYLRSLAKDASTHWDMRQVPCDVESEFVYKHYFGLLKQDEKEDK
jgi:hypothetical protein